MRYGSPFGSLFGCFHILVVCFWILSDTLQQAQTSSTARNRNDTTATDDRWARAREKSYRYQYTAVHSSTGAAVLRHLAAYNESMTIHEKTSILITSVDSHDNDFETINIYEHRTTSRKVHEAQ